jgi:hypothetical protein
MTTGAKGMDTIDNSSFDYQERTVAFIDVLGFAELVKQSDTSLTARAKLAKLIAINALFEQFVAKFLGFGDAAFFSDCFVLSMQPPDIRALFVIRETGYLCRYLLLQGFPCRGAITTGSLYHQGRFVVGPALVNAYEMERAVAIYPRVILDERTMAYWRNEFLPGSAHPQLETLVKRDRDGQHFLDIFSPTWSAAFLPWTEFIPSQDQVPADPRKFLEDAHKLIEAGLAANSANLKVRAKYEWLATEHREHASALTNA